MQPSLTEAMTVVLNALRHNPDKFNILHIDTLSHIKVHLRHHLKWFRNNALARAGLMDNIHMYAHNPIYGISLNWLSTLMRRPYAFAIFEQPVTEAGALSLRQVTEGDYSVLVLAFFNGNEVAVGTKYTLHARGVTASVEICGYRLAYEYDIPLLTITHIKSNYLVHKLQLPMFTQDPDGYPIPWGNVDFAKMLHGYRIFT